MEQRGTACTELKWTELEWKDGFVIVATIAIAKLLLLLAVAIAVMDSSEWRTNDGVGTRDHGAESGTRQKGQGIIATLIPNSREPIKSIHHRIILKT